MNFEEIRYWKFKNSFKDLIDDIEGDIDLIEYYPALFSEIRKYDEISN